MASTAVTTTRPTADALAPFRAALAKAEAHFKMALPATVQKYLTPDRLSKITLSALSRNPLLLQCTPESVLRSVMDAASLGLEPSGGVLGHAYLVPYRNGKTGKYEAQLIVGYRGLIALARRSAEIARVEAHVVYQADEFEVEYGIEPRLVHRPSLEAERGDIVAVYCIAAFKDGSRHAELMTIAEVESVRARSRARDNGPWRTDYAEMCRKTVVRRAAKYWPLSSEFVKALEHEDAAEAGVEVPTELVPLGEVSIHAPALEDGPAGEDATGEPEIIEAPPAEPTRTSKLAEQIRSNRAAAEMPTGNEQPDDLPPFDDADAPPTAANDKPEGDGMTRDQREAQWREKRRKAGRTPGQEG